MVGFTERVLKETALVYDLRWEDASGQARYGIVHVTPHKHDAFLRALEQDAPLELRDYGEVLYTGLKEPDAAIKAELREKYGMYASPE